MENKFHMSIKKIIAHALYAISISLLICCQGCQAGNETATDDLSSLKQKLVNAHIPEYRYEVISTHPHNHNYFTEGFEYDGTILYESTGLYGKSKLIKMNLATGQVLKEINLSAKYFAEGITVLNNQIFQLTYRERTGFVYNKETFALLKSFTVNSDGWGLTNNGSQLVMSNGSSTLNYIDPVTLKVTRSLNVTVDNQPVNYLNELEYIDGQIFANIWPSSLIVIIDPNTGKVTGWLDIKALNPKLLCKPAECIANGIAYNSQDKTLLLTGKYWPTIYIVKISKITEK